MLMSQIIYNDELITSKKYSELSEEEIKKDFEIISRECAKELENFWPNDKIEIEMEFSDHRTKIECSIIKKYRYPVNICLIDTPILYIEKGKEEILNVLNKLLRDAHAYEEYNLLKRGEENIKIMDEKNEKNN